MDLMQYKSGKSNLKNWKVIAIANSPLPPVLNETFWTGMKSKLQKRITSISLVRTSIQQIDSSFFCDLTKLETLNLAENSITHLDFRNPKTCKEML